MDQLCSQLPMPRSNEDWWDWTGHGFETMKAKECFPSFGWNETDVNSPQKGKGLVCLEYFKIFG